MIGAAAYKGRFYRLLRLGLFTPPAGGRRVYRAKLAFADGSREFWVDRAALTLVVIEGEAHDGRRTA